MTESEQEKTFQARIDRGDTIEPKDWMPEKYRKQLTRIMSQHAHSEVVGMLPEANWITRAPNFRRKKVLLAKVQDEAGHGLYLYMGAETLGASREQLYDDLLTGKAKYSNIFNYPTLNWADMGVIGWLVDGAAIINQTMLAKASYGPYSRAMIRICREENFHKKQGYEICVALSKGTLAQKKMLQESVDRFWWPVLMMFGPSDKDSPNSAALMKWKIKREGNDNLRQRFVNMVVAQARPINVLLPDPHMKKNEETGNWEFGKINWGEFWQAVKGNGPCSRERLNAKRKAHEEGAWVRQAAMAYTAKKCKTEVA